MRERDGRLTMENHQEKETFTYIYSAKQQEEIKRIRDRYLPPKEDKMEQVRRMDAGAAQKAAAAGIVTGILGALLLGLGMSLVMTDIGETLRLGEKACMILGIVVGIIGMTLAAGAYPVYLRVGIKERKKIAPEILRLTEELMK